MAKADLTTHGIQHGGISKNLKRQHSRASLDSAWKTAKKTFRQLRYDNMFYPDEVWAPVKQTIAGAYKKVISRQYPKYTGPKPPNVGGWYGPNTEVGKALASTGVSKGPMVKSGGRMIRASGAFSDIPSGYLTNVANQKHIAARTARVARGASIAKSITPGGLALEGLIGAYKVYKRATGPGGTEFHSGKAGEHYLDLSTNKPGKYGVDY